MSDSVFGTLRLPPEKRGDNGWGGPWPKAGAPWTQHDIDKQRVAIMTTVMMEAVRLGYKRLPKLFLWWPEERYDTPYLMKWGDGVPGNRPPWLKDRNLVIDIGEIPLRVARAIEDLRKQSKGTTETELFSNNEAALRLAQSIDPDSYAVVGGKIRGVKGIKPGD